MKIKFTAEDLAYALEQAAVFLEMEEWPEDDGGAQEAANREGATRIRKMRDRLPKEKIYRGLSFKDLQVAP